MSEPIKGYKVFNPDWTCRDFQYEVGKTFEDDVTPKCCSRGFHFCTKASDCFNYYDFNPENKVAEVLALGMVDTESGDTKCCTNKIQIVREIPGHCNFIPDHAAVIRTNWALEINIIESFHDFIHIKGSIAGKMCSFFKI